MEVSLRCTGNKLLYTAEYLSDGYCQDQEFDRHVRGSQCTLTTTFESFAVETGVAVIKKFVCSHSLISLLYFVWAIGSVCCMTGASKDSLLTVTTELGQYHGHRETDVELFAWHKIRTAPRPV